MNYYALDEALAMLEGRELSISVLIENINGLKFSDDILTETGIVIVTEASFKDVLDSVKKAFIKIKDYIVNFFKWVGTKVKSLFRTIVNKIKSLGLKKKYNDAKKKENVQEAAGSSTIVDKFKSTKIVLLDIREMDSQIIFTAAHNLANSNTSPEEAIKSVTGWKDINTDLDFFINSGFNEKYAEACYNMISVIEKCKPEYEKDIKKHEDLISELSSKSELDDETKNKISRIREGITKLQEESKVTQSLIELAQRCLKQCMHCNELAAKALGGEDINFPSIIGLSDSIKDFD